MIIDRRNLYISNISLDGRTSDDRSSLTSLDSPEDETLFYNNYKDISAKSGLLVFKNGIFHQCNLNELEQLKKLGAGQFGTVYMCKCRETGLVMAVKEIPLMTKDDRKKAIVDVLTMMETRCCSNIVSYFGCFIGDNKVGICMEIMETGFDKILEKNGAIPEMIVARTLRDAVKALQFLKEHMKLHRDIKPANILVDGNGHIKLCDFGICGKLISTDEAVTNSKGTYLYLAPERMDGVENYGVHADVWSLGITGYELLTGVHPYANACNQFQINSEVVSGPTPKLDNSKYSDEACEFISSCLQKDPKQRLLYKELMKTRFYVAARAVTRQIVAQWLNRLLNRNKQ